MPGHAGDIDIRQRVTAYDGYFRIDRYLLRHRLFDGGWSGEISRELLERGSAVAVLPYDPHRDEVVLIEQFRVGALGDDASAWVLETVAGIIEPGEAMDEVARRESVEECGLMPDRLDLICSYLPSPGGCSERTTMFAGRVDTSQAGGIFGLGEEGEDIKVHVLSVAEALTWLNEGRVRTSTGIIALQWLALNHDDLRRRWLDDAPSG